MKYKCKLSLSYSAFNHLLSLYRYTRHCKSSFISHFYPAQCAPLYKSSATEAVKMQHEGGGGMCLAANFLLFILFCVCVQVWCSSRTTGRPSACQAPSGSQWKGKTTVQRSAARRTTRRWPSQRRSDTTASMCIVSLPESTLYSSGKQIRKLHNFQSRLFHL